MPVPSFIGVETAIANAASVVCNYPAGVVSGDLVVAVAHAYDNGIADKSGWEVLRSGANLTMFWKIYAGTEGASETFSLNSGSGGVGSAIMVFRGSDKVNLDNVSAVNNSTSSTAVCPSVTTTVDDCLIVMAGGTFDDLSSPFTPPGGVDERADLPLPGGGGTTDAAMFAGTASQASAGATGTYSWSMSGSNNWRTMTVAFAPDIGALQMALMGVGA